MAARVYPTGQNTRHIRGAVACAESCGGVSLQWGKQHWHAEGEHTTWRVPWPMHTAHALLWRINPGWLHKDSQQQWQGPWAAWRWLRSANISPGPNQWHLTFSTHGHHVAGAVWVTPQNRALIQLLFHGAPHVLS